MIEKILHYYIIANLDTPTKYVKSNGDGNYCLIDNLLVATKFTNRKLTERICNECSQVYGNELIVIPLNITYELIDESNI